MERLLKWIKEIELALAKTGVSGLIDFPRIVAIGPQSVGKSSVIEAIVRIDFLPRGAELVTKWPLELTLVHREGEIYGEFDHLPNVKFEEDFSNKVREEILRRTCELTEDKPVIVSTPIWLTIYSPKVPNLRLVDLPGITHNPIGNQNESFCKDSYDLVKSYIDKEKTIILAVAPANFDIANSEAIMLAREVDPEGQRTIGVITKVDLLSNDGQNVRSYLTGENNNLFHGYVGVVCRSFKDTENNKSIFDALDDEELFFKNDDAYYDIAKSQGTRYLAEKLSNLLHVHIRRSLPYIESKLEDNLNQYKKILRRLGPDPTWDSDSAARERITKYIDDYCSRYESIINGSADINRVSKAFGGSNIYRIFEDFRSKRIDPLRPLSETTDEMLLDSIYHFSGFKSSIFIPEVACESILRKEVSKFEDPCLDCSEKVYRHLTKTVVGSMPPTIKPLRLLREKIAEVMERLIEEKNRRLLSVIRDKIASEEGYMNFDHDDFQKIRPYAEITRIPTAAEVNSLYDNYRITRETFSQLSVRVGEERFLDMDSDTDCDSSLGCMYRGGYEVIENNVNDAPRQISPSDTSKVITMKRVVDGYFSILKKNFKDAVPKYIATFLIKDTLKDMRNRLQASLQAIEDPMDLIREDPEVEAKRAKSIDLIEKFEKGLRKVRILMDD